MNDFSRDTHDTLNYGTHAHMQTSSSFKRDDTLTPSNPPTHQLTKQTINQCYLMYNSLNIYSRLPDRESFESKLNQNPRIMANDDFPSSLIALYLPTFPTIFDGIIL